MHPFQNIVHFVGQLFLGPLLKERELQKVGQGLRQQATNPFFQVIKRQNKHSVSCVSKQTLCLMPLGLVSLAVSYLSGWQASICFSDFETFSRCVFLSPKLRICDCDTRVMQGWFAVCGIIFVLTRLYIILYSI